MILSARDYFFHPHHARFHEYLRCLYVSAVALVALRVPFDPEGGLPLARLARPLGGAYVYLLLAYLLIGETFDGAGMTVWWLLRSALFVAVAFAVLLGLSAFLQVFGRLGLRRMAQYAPDVAQFRRLLLLPCLLLLAVLLVARLLGGQEAVSLFGVRFHLPTLLLPLVVLWASLLVLLADSAPQRMVWLPASAMMALLPVVVYRLSSHDNGGSLILAMGVVSVLGLGSRDWRLPAAVLAVVLAGGLGLAWLNESIRFELAWGGEEGRVLFYDEAKNLRLARDMARSGGLLGHGIALPIPSEMRSNIQSDLVAGYVVGFFGWLVFAVMVFAYWLFYNHLFGGLYQSLPRFRAARRAPDPPGPEPRKFLLLYSSSLVLTFAFQALYVLCATFQPYVPFTGLDLQPLSTSAISVLSFFLVLLGSVAMSHTLGQTLPDE